MKCPSPMSVKNPKEGVDEMVTVPCGKCGACRANRRNDWSFRIKQELKAASSAFFITLTYEDENLPLSETGLPTLSKRHWQLFIKKLRKRLSAFTDDSLRYYTVGEYGEKTSRPHYHTIMFNLHPDLVPSLQNIWSHGFVDIGTVEDASIHYVTKHHVNKGDKEYEFVNEETGEVFEREPEFTTMSRNPGIGYNYVEKVRDWHLAAERNYVVNNGYKQRLPRYYRDKLFDPVTRKAMSIRNIPELDKNYHEEIKRLKNLKIKNPQSYILRSQYNEAKKVKDKANETDTF